MRFISCSSLIFLAALAAAPARADLLVSIESGTFQEGQGGVLNVFVESAGGAELNNFQLQFHVAPTTGSGRLEFAAPDFNALRVDPDYVFFNLGSPFGAAVAGALPNDTFNTGDSLPGGGPDNVAIASGPSGRRLLTTLVLAPGAGVLAPAAGSVFTVSLSTDPGRTFFNSYDATSGDDVPVAFSSATARIVVAAAPVPEPLGAVSLAVGLVVALAASRREKAV